MTCLNVDEVAMFDDGRTARPVEKDSKPAQSTARGHAPLVDLVHLTRQCQGDSALEDELLERFHLQSRALCAQLSKPANAPLELKARIAHTLRGSALAIGAGRVADAAREVEAEIEAALERTPARAERLSQAIAALEASVADVVAEIERIRR
jgi:HPt (histidine-containing phosphotransfer) domain-containing protein